MKSSARVLAIFLLLSLSFLAMATDRALSESALPISRTAACAHNPSNLTNIVNSLRYMYGRTHMCSETTSYKLNCDIPMSSLMLLDHLSTVASLALLTSASWCTNLAYSARFLAYKINKTIIH